MGFRRGTPERQICLFEAYKNPIPERRKLLIYSHFYSLKRPLNWTGSVFPLLRGAWDNNFGVSLGGNQAPPSFWEVPGLSRVPRSSRRLPRTSLSVVKTFISWYRTSGPWNWFLSLGKPKASSTSTPSWKIFDGFLKACSGGFWRALHLRQVRRPLKTPSETPSIGSSQTWLFQTWLFAIFVQKRSVAPFCALLRSFADLRLHSFARIWALLRSIACFCVPPRLERPRLGTAEVKALRKPSGLGGSEMNPETHTTLIKGVGFTPLYLQKGIVLGHRFPL